MAVPKKQQNFDLVIKRINSLAHKFESESKFQDAKDTCLGGIQLIESHYGNLHNLKKFLLSWISLNAVGNYESTEASSKYLSGKYIIDILILSILEEGDPLKYLKKAQKTINYEGFSFPFGELEKLLKAILKKSKDPSNVPTALRKKVAWCYAHGATMDYRLTVEPLNYRKIEREGLFKVALHFLISLLLDSGHVWTIAQLGETYRTIGNLTALQMFGTIKSAKDHYFDLSFKCFDTAKNMLEAEQENQDYLGLAWVYAHWEAAILNSRREEKYDLIAGMQEKSRDYYAETTLSTKIYHWLRVHHGGYHWLKTVKNILRDGEDLSDFNIAFNIFYGATVLLENYSEKHSFLQTRVEPNETSREVPVMLSVAILIHVHHWDAPKIGEKRLLKVTRLICHEYLSQHRNSTGMFDQFLVWNYENAMELSRACYYYLICDGALKGKTSPKPSLNNEGLHKFIKEMALMTLVFLLMEQDENNLIAPSVDCSNKNFMTSLSWATFVELAEREKYWFCAELINYLFRIQLFQETGKFSMEQDFTFIKFEDFLKELNRTLESNPKLASLESCYGVDGKEKDSFSELNFLQAEVYQRYFDKTNHTLETSVLTTLKKLRKSQKS